jgi:hypothetical protein
LSESIEMCVSLDGDRIVAANPPAPDRLEHLHSTIVLLVEHHRRFGYRHFVVNHFWRSATELADLRNRLDADPEFHCFLLTLPIEENLRRIQRRASARAIDEREFEQMTFAEEYKMLGPGANSDFGEPFDVSAPPSELVEAMLRRLGARLLPNKPLQPIARENARSG